MSADKFQSVHEAFANAFNASNPHATGTESSHAAFDHEILSEAFNEPRLNEAGTDRSPARFDHATLTGIFSELPTDKQTTFDQAFAEILSERPQLATHAQAPRPGFDHQVVAEILSESPTISTNTIPSQPSFDHQALAEMLTESRADPIDPPTSVLSFDTGPSSSSAPFSREVQQAEPMAQAFAASSSTTADGARPPRPKSLLAKLHQIFSTKEEPALSDVQNDALSRPLEGQLPAQELMARAISPTAQDAQQHNSLSAERFPVSFEQDTKSSQPSHQPNIAKLVASDVAVTSPTGTASAWPLHATSPADDISSQISITAEPSPFTFERSPSLPEVPSPGSTPPLALKAESLRTSPSNQSENLALAEETLRSVASVNSESAQSQRPRSSSEERSPLPATKSSASELSSPILSDRLKDMLPASSAAAASPPTNVESARPQRLQRLLAELTSTVSSKSKLSLPTSEKEPSRPTSSTQLESLEPLAKTTSVAPQVNAGSAAIRPLETQRLLSDIPTLDSTNAESESPDLHNSSAPIYSDQTSPQEPEANIVVTAALPDAEGTRPQETELPASLLSGSKALHVTPGIVGAAAEPALPLPTHAGPTQPKTRSSLLTDPAELDWTDQNFPLPIVEEDFLSHSFPGEGDGVVPSVQSVIAARPTAAEDAPPQLASSLLAALRVLNAKPSPPAVEKEPSRATPTSQLGPASISAKAVYDPVDTEKALARQTKSLLTEIPALDSTDAKSLAATSEKEPSGWPASNRPTDVAPTANDVAVTPPVDTESAVARAQQAKLLLAELDLNTAIRFRWVMRDIRSKRTKFSPVSANDLTALMDLGLVELREGVPRLTGLGVLALD